MISRDSKSYPYLAIAQHYAVPYSRVLKYSDDLKFKMTEFPPFTQWRYSVWRLEREKFKISVD